MLLSSEIFEEVGMMNIFLLYIYCIKKVILLLKKKSWIQA